MPKQVKNIMKALQLARQAENYKKEKALKSGIKPDVVHVCMGCVHFRADDLPDLGTCAARGGGLEPNAAAFRATTCKGELFVKAAQK